MADPCVFLELVFNIIRLELLKLDGGYFVRERQTVPQIKDRFWAWWRSQVRLVEK